MTHAPMRQPLLRISRSALLYTAFILLSGISCEMALGRFSILEESSGTLIQETPAWLPYIVHILIFWMTFFTSARAFAVHDPLMKEKRPADASPYWFLHTGEFHTETAVILILLLILPIKYGCSILSLFPINFLWKKLCQLLLFFPAMTVINISAHRTAEAAWNAPTKLRKQKRLWQKENNFTSLLLTLLGSAFVYTLGFLVIPVFLPAVYTLLVMFIRILWMLRTPILVSLAAFLLLMYGRAWRIRHKFLSKLLKMAQDRKSNFHLSSIRGARLSLFFPWRKANFIVRVRDKTYSVRLMCDPFRFLTMYFGPDGTGLRHIYLRFRGIELFSLEIPFTYDFEGEGEKLIVLTPIPSIIRSIDRNHTADLDVGDRVGDYRLFNGTGFLGMLERDCLER